MREHAKPRRGETPVTARDSSVSPQFQRAPVPEPARDEGPSIADPSAAPGADLGHRFDRIPVHPEGASPLQRVGPSPRATATRPANGTGLTDSLKAGLEHLSGVSMDDVTVHYNSPHPARLQAEAYTQGTQIHVGAGQERHLAHEAWHVVQQKQGRVAPTMRLRGQGVNDNASLEREADVMGERALRSSPGSTMMGDATPPLATRALGTAGAAPIQAKWLIRDGQRVEVPDDYDLQDGETLEQPGTGAQQTTPTPVQVRPLRFIPRSVLNRATQQRAPNQTARTGNTVPEQPNTTTTSFIGPQVPMDWTPSSQPASLPGPMLDPMPRPLEMVSLSASSPSPVTKTPPRFIPRSVSKKGTQQPRQAKPVKKRSATQYEEEKKEDEPTQNEQDEKKRLRLTDSTVPEQQNTTTTSVIGPQLPPSMLGPMPRPPPMDSLSTSSVTTAPKVRAVEVGAGTAKNSDYMRTLLWARHMKRDRSLKEADIDYTATDVAEKGGRGKHLEEAPSDIKTEDQVDANNLSAHFAKESLDAVVGANPFGDWKTPGASYGLRQTTQPHQSTEDMSFDPRFLQSAQQVLKPGGKARLFGRTNLLNEETPTTGPFVNASHDDLKQAAELGFDVHVRHVKQDGQRKFQRPDTQHHDRNQDLGPFNTELVFRKRQGRGGVKLHKGKKPPYAALNEVDSDEELEPDQFDGGE